MAPRQQPRGNAAKKPRTRRATRAGQPRQQSAMQSVRAAPVARSFRAPVAGPRTTTGRRGGTSITTVCNEEPMAFLTSSATANTEVVGAIPLSAASSFLPWLQQIGANYGRYRFRSLHCWYEPVCASTTPGQVTLVMVFDENDADPASITSTNILQTEGNRKSSVWDRTNLVSYDPNRAQFRWYVVKNNPAPTTLANISVPAWLLFSIFSSQQSVGLGRLMCRYEVEFDSAIAPAMQG